MLVALFAWDWAKQRWSVASYQPPDNRLPGGPLRMTLTISMTSERLLGIMSVL